MRILGIDYGEAKIGLALSEGSLSEPLGIIKISNLKSQILNLCRQYGIEKIVIGLSEGKMAEKQHKFARQIAKITKLPVEFQEETLTTWEALSKIREIGKKIKDEDAISAALILQAYLERKEN